MYLSDLCADRDDLSVMSFESKMKQRVSYTIPSRLSTTSYLDRLVQVHACCLRQRLRPAWFDVPTSSYYHTVPIDESLVNGTNPGSSETSQIL